MKKIFAIMVAAKRRLATEGGGHVDVVMNFEPKAFLPGEEREENIQIALADIANDLAVRCFYWNVYDVKPSKDNNNALDITNPKSEVWYTVSSHIVYLYGEEGEEDTPLAPHIPDPDIGGEG